MNTIQSTLENNKLIAEFMEFEISHKINHVPSYLPNCMKNSEHLKINNPDNLPFHSNWDWLMQVVEKIESLGYRIEIVKHICRIHLSDKEKIIISENIPKIEAVYNACIEFIKWYNDKISREKE